MNTIQTIETDVDKKYRLLPSLMSSKLGDCCYFYDGNAVHTPVIFIPPQKVPQRAYDVVQRLTAANPNREPQTLKSMQELFHDPKDISALNVLIRRGYLEESPSPSIASQPAAILISRSESSSPQESGWSQEILSNLIESFNNKEAKHFFNTPQLFNVPEDIDDQDVDVGIVGIPFSTVPESIGTTSAPTYLRMLSQRHGFWFDIYNNGAFSEFRMDDTMPAILCKGVVLKDYGDLGANTRTVADLFAEIQTIIEKTIIPHHIRPIFLGGDHAITFPLVDTFIRQYPDLCLIHLDAHSDLFYSDRILFNHGTSISNLLFYSNLAQVYSFGLRKEYRIHAENVARITQQKQFLDRVHLFSIGAFKRLLSDHTRFEELLQTIPQDRPCYLSIDLDVLSAPAIANQLSTPCGTGLEWWELYEAVIFLCSKLNIIACDVVELNLHHKNQSDDAMKLPFLLLLLIEGLSHRSVT